jgi:hypothetical protein
VKKIQDQKIDVQSYPYTECRERHQWTAYDGTVDMKAKVGVRVQQCPNCTMKKVSTISLREETKGQHLRSPRYIAPKDYRIPGGLSHYDRGAIRAYNFFSEVKSNTSP